MLRMVVTVTVEVIFTYPLAVDLSLVLYAAVQYGHAT